jgi:hypothetical protein
MRMNCKLSGRFVIPGTIRKIHANDLGGPGGEQTIACWESQNYTQNVGVYTWIPVFTVSYLNQYGK